jgi:hypothetical protein
VVFENLGRGLTPAERHDGAAHATGFSNRWLKSAQTSPVTAQGPLGGVFGNRGVGRVPELVVISADTGVLLRMLLYWWV